MLSRREEMDSLRGAFYIFALLLVANFFALVANHMLLRDIREALREQNKMLLTEESVGGGESENENDATAKVTAYVAKKGSKTATATKAVPGWTCAVSRDLAHWLGGKVWIDGVGVRLVSDLTSDHLKKRVDVLVGKSQEVESIGNAERKVVFLGKG